MELLKFLPDWIYYLCGGCCGFYAIGFIIIVFLFTRAKEGDYEYKHRI